MKTLIILYGFLTLQTCNQNQNAEKTNSIYPLEYRQTVTTNAKQDTILNNIQKKITVASYDGFAKRDTQKLDEIEVFLKSNKTGNENLKKYWIAYINYYKTIIALQTGNKAVGEKSNKKGIAVLESIANKNSEDYALLALSKGLSYSYASGMEAPAISNEIKKLIEKGITADNSNFRVHYAQGSLDLYTPKEYGGGAIAENALLKAIDLPEKNTDNSQLPSWGKEEAYGAIIGFYLREDKKDKAKTHFDQAKKLFPDSYVIQTYQRNF